MDVEFETLILHRHPHLIDQCCELINSEWPRSHTARRRGLECSRDSLPTCLVLVKNNGKVPRVVGHSKITPIPSIPQAAFVESVVIDRNLRGKGLGRILMQETEKHMLSIGLMESYLSTYDQQGFYAKLGYDFCERVSIYGCSILQQFPSVEQVGQQESTVQKNTPLVQNIPNAPLPPPPPPPPPAPVLKVPSLIKNTPTSANDNLQKKDYMKKVIFNSA